MRGIFISYRREDTAGHAGRLAADLGARYGSTEVFMDIDSILPGIEFGDPIKQALDSCRVALVLIGPQWLAAASDGRRRIDAADDWVQKEVASALSRPEMAVIPILVEGASMPRSEDLPGALAALAGIQACELRNVQWKYDVDGICAALDRLTQKRRLRDRSRWAARAIGAVGVAALAAIAVGVLRDDHHASTHLSAGEPRPENRVSIDALRSVARADGVQEWVVTGTVTKLGANRVYAVARPDPTAAHAAARSTERWYVSEPTLPDHSGQWRAVVIVKPPTAKPLSVVAVIAPYTRVRATRPAPTVQAPAASRDSGSAGVESPVAPCEDCVAPIVVPPKHPPTAQAPTRRRRRASSRTELSLRVKGPRAGAVVERSRVVRTPPA